MGIYLIKCVHGIRLEARCEPCRDELGAWRTERNRVVKVDRPWQGGP